jgi:hypothetical protein
LQFRVFYEDRLRARFSNERKRHHNNELNFEIAACKINTYIINRPET